MNFFKARTESIVSLAVALLLLTAVASASIYEFRRFLFSLDWFARAEEVIRTLKAVQLDATQAETGQRGFLLTEKSSYLQPYSEGRRRLWPHMAQLENLMDAGHEQTSDLLDLRRLLVAKMGELDQTIHLRQTTNQIQPSLRMVRSNLGKYLMDDINDKIDAMVEREQKELAMRAQILHHHILSTIWFFIAGFLLSVLAVLWAFRLLSKEINGHQAAENLARTNEQQSRENENLLRRLLDNARDYALYLLDPTGKILTWTETAERLHGFSSSDVLHHSYALVFTEEDRASGKPERMLKEALNAGRYEERTLRRRKDESTFTADVSLTPIYNADGSLRGFAQITRDMTEKVQAEEALDRAQKQISQLQKMDAIGRLAGGIAHDFNNLLTGILGYGEDLLETLPPESPARVDVQEIVKAGLRAAQLTRQLLAFSRKQIAAVRVLNLNTVVVEFEKMLRRLLPENIKINLALAEALVPVKADPSQIEQILMNLVLNARDAMPHGGHLTIETSNVQLDDAYAHERFEIVPGPYVLLAVSDVGHGMTKEIQAQIFEPFFTTKPSGHGTGLGLSTVYGIVKQNNGHVFVYSHPGIGTTFKIYLPRTFDPGEPLVIPSAISAAPRGHETVLVVEDEPVVRGLATRTLTNAGFTVLMAKGGAQAVKLSQDQAENAIDLILSDVVMPEMSGPVVTQNVLKRHPNAKVLYMSGYTQSIIVNGGILKPGIDLIEKPFNTSELIRKVRSVLDG